MRQLEPTIDGDRMVDRPEQRPAVLHDPEQAAAERLVVVDDVEVAPAGRQRPARPQAEGARLGEPGRAHHCELERVDRTVELLQVRDPEGVRIAVEVEARHGLEGHPFVELRIRLP